MITKKSKFRNPQKYIATRSVNGINYEILDLPDFDEISLLRKFSKIIDEKFPRIKNKIPLIVFKKIGDKGGYYHYDDNYIEINSDNDNLNNVSLRYLFHELGHFIYDKYLSETELKEFGKYINSNRKNIDLLDLSRKFEKYDLDKLRIEYPFEFVIISSLQDTKDFKYYIKYVDQKDKYAPFSSEFIDWFTIRNNKKYRVFDKPPSDYIINKEEIFCEIFANYMMYNIRLLHSDNKRILRYVLPELRE